MKSDILNIIMLVCIFDFIEISQVPRGYKIKITLQSKTSMIPATLNDYDYKIRVLCQTCHLKI